MNYNAKKSESVKFFLPLFLFLFQPLSHLYATNWYVDNAAVGANNGTSWTDAWTSPMAISGVSPGDFVYVSGGPNGSSQTYTLNQFWDPPSGTSGSRITYQIGQDSLHDGTAVFNFVQTTFGPATANPWISGLDNANILGDAGDGQEHFQITGYATAFTNITADHLSYINLGGVDGNSLASSNNMEIDHLSCIVANMNADHFLFASFTGSLSTDNRIHDCAISVPHISGGGNGADCFQCNGTGFSIYNNSITGYSAAYTGNQHQDGEQCLGNASNISYYNNTITDIANYAFFGDGFAGGFSNVLIYNNVAQIDDPTVASGSPGGFIVGVDGGFTGTQPCVFNNIIIVQNEVVDYHNNQAAVALNNVTAFTSTFTGCVIANNLLVNSGNVSTTGDLTSLVETNVSISKAQAPATFASYTEFGGNSNNLHLLVTDPFAAYTGTDLTSVSSALTVDKGGLSRPQGPAWCVGVYELIPPTNPVIVLQPLPATQVVPPGANVSITANARGAAPLTLQWFNGSTPIGGATNSTLTLTNVSLSNNGTYTLMATNGSGVATSSGVSLTVTNAAFIITQPVSQSVTSGGNVTFTAQATGVPSPTYQWQLNNINLTNNGVVSGATSPTLSLNNLTPSYAGDYTVIATNTLGMSTSTPAVLTVNTVPVFTTVPISQTVGLNGNLILTAAATGNPTPTISWQQNGVTLTDGGAVSGSNTSTLTLSDVSQANSGNYTAVATNITGSVSSSIAVIAVIGVPPAVTQQPSSQTAFSGTSVTFEFNVSGSPAPIIQWSKNGIPIPGANNLNLTLNNITTANSGTYTATATNIVSSVMTSSAVLNVLRPSRLINLSARANVGTASDVVITGFVVSGGSKSLLLRAVGPSLSPFGVADSISNPLLQLFTGSSVLQQNSSWGGTSALSTAFSDFGAFAFNSPQSTDAALLDTLQPGPYTALVSGLNGSTGITLAEVYDADQSESPSGRLINLSARANVGPGSDVLIAGIVVYGDVPEKVLIRAIGPSLAQFGLSNVLSAPLLQIFDGQTLVQQNSAWGGATALSGAFAQVGAFPLSDPNSDDAAILVTLNPGTYTAVVSGLNGATGIALAEIFEVP